MSYKIEELMARLGCDKWPARWSDFYDEVAEELEKHGNPLLDPLYYDELQEKYGVLPTHKELYKRAAVQIAQSEELSLFLSLLCRAMRDRDLIEEDLSNLSMPDSHKEQDPLSCRMLPGLVLCQSIPDVYEKMEKRGVPDHILYPSLRVAEAGVNAYMARHNGEEGYADFGWWQRAYDAKIYRVGRLELEFPTYLLPTYSVYRNENGDSVALAKDMMLHRDGFALGSRGFEDETGSWMATVEENEESYMGYPFLENGYVSKERVVLPKREWRVAIAPNDPVVSLHIPSGGGLDHAAIEETLRDAREFLKNCFPDYDYKAFICASWLMDPQLVDMLGEEANIARFCRRFAPMCMKSSGEGVFNFIFLKPDMNFDIRDLPENSKLERGLKNHYLSGKAIYEMYGYFF